MSTEQPKPKSLEELVKEQIDARKAPVETPEAPVEKVEEAAAEDTKVEGTAEETQEETTTETEEVASEEKTGDEKPSAAPANSALDFFRQEFYKLGYDKTEVDALSLEEISREYRLIDATEKEETEEEPEEKPRKSRKKPEPEEVEEEAPKGETAKERQIRLAKLGYDPALEAFVEYKNGVAIPKADTGERGEKAAEKINEWADAYRARQRSLVEDPVGTLAPDIQEIIKEQVAKALGEYDQKLQSKDKDIAAANAAVREQQAIEAFWSKHDKELFVTDETGALRKSIKSKTYIPTTRGEQFEKILTRLSATSKAPQSVILNQALEILNELSPVVEKKPSRDERKKEFLDKGRTNKTTPLVATGKDAKPSEKAATKGAKVSLMEAMKSNAELANNPFIAELMKQN